MTRSKYGNIRTENYASKKEAARAQQLKLMQQAGLITDLREQVVFEIAPAVIINGRKSAARKYIADFVYIEDGVQIIEDVKGAPLTDVYVLKRHLMKVLGYTILET